MNASSIALSSSAYPYEPGPDGPWRRAVGGAEIEERRPPCARVELHRREGAAGEPWRDVGGAEVAPDPHGPERLASEVARKLAAHAAEDVPQVPRRERLLSPRRRPAAERGEGERGGEVEQHLVERLAGARREVGGAGERGLLRERPEEGSLVRRVLVHRPPHERPPAPVERRVAPGRRVERRAIARVHEVVVQQREV